MSDSNEVSSIQVHPSRRKHARFNIDAEGAITAAGLEETIVLRNISMQGCRGISTLPLRPGQDILFTLQPPVVRKPLYNRGRVAWASRMPDGRYETGLSLENFDISVVAPALIRREQPSEYALYSGNLQPVAAAKPAPVLEPRQKLVSPAVYKRIFGIVVVAALAAAAFYIFRTQMHGYIQPDAAYKIEGFMFDQNGESLAYIDGKVVKEGQTVNGITVVRIDKDSITIRNRAGLTKNIKSGTGDVPPSEAAYSILTP